MIRSAVKNPLAGKRALRLPLASHHMVRLPYLSQFSLTVPSSCSPLTSSSPSCWAPPWWPGEPSYATSALHHTIIINIINSSPLHWLPPGECSNATSALQPPSSSCPTHWRTRTSLATGGIVDEQECAENHIIIVTAYFFDVKERWLQRLRKSLIPILLHFWF